MMDSLKRDMKFFIKNNYALCMSQIGIIILLSIEKSFNYNILGLYETIYYDN